MKWMILMCTLACYISGCNDNKSIGIVSNEDSTAAQKSPAHPSIEEELQKLAPYSTDQVKALLPATLGGGKLTEASSDKAMGTAFAKGIYQLSDTTGFEMSVFDCGGNEGASFYKFQFANMLNVQPEGEEEEVKTIDFNGSKAIEHYNNNNYRSTFSYLNDRFLLILESESLDLEGLKKIANNLKLK